MKGCRVLAGMVLGSLLAAAPARAGSISLLLGPGNAGNGGSNPLGLPPGPTDVGIRWVTDGGFDTTVSLLPGLLFGKRFQDGGWYVSVGGGLLIDANGVGVGAYSSLGFVSGGGGAGLHFTADYTQTLGAASSGIIAPGAARIGALWGY